MHRVVRLYPVDFVCYRDWRARNNPSRAFLRHYRLSFNYYFDATIKRQSELISDDSMLDRVLSLWLDHHFRDKLVVAYDDPMLNDHVKKRGIADTSILVDVGVHAFAHQAFLMCHNWLANQSGEYQDFRISRVVVSEEGGSAAFFEPGIADCCRSLVNNQKEA